MNVHKMFHVKHWSGGTAMAALALAALAACSSPEEIAAKTGTAAPPVPAAPPAPAPDSVAFEDNAKNGEATRDFAYAWPAEVSAIPELAARLTADRDKLLAEQKADWEESLREFAGSDCVGCVNRDYAMQWDVVANLPRFLSLSGAWNAYTGGAHGNYAWQALVWDRETKTAFDPKTMFTSPAALQGALGDAWCKALKGARAKKGMTPEDEDGIFPCPPIADLTVLVGSSDRKSFNRIGLIAAPYVAGSYAEGEYEVTLPVTAKVLAAVKPEYKAAFASPK